VFAATVMRRPEARLIVAPRHMERVPEVEAACVAAGFASPA
jgi:3-deoxy-D-manno-octulosonic-acid transferase